MLHKNRKFSLAQINTPEELVKKLTEHTWCSCNAFMWKNWIFANDSTGPDGAQEYAVINDQQQYDSWTVSWMTPEDLLQHLLNLKVTDTVYYGPITNIFQSPKDHGTCGHCA